MGASASKAAQKGVRKFPTRAPGAGAAATSTTRPPPPPRASASTSQSQPASHTRDDATTHTPEAGSGRPDETSTINPAFAHRLRQMGVAEPNPTYSPSSIATPAPDASAFGQRDHVHAPSAPRFAPAAGNATLGVLQARQRLEELAEREFADMGRSGGDHGKEFLDVATIRDALVLRQRGTPAAEIEKRLRLKQGVVARLGRPGLVSPTS